MTSRLEVELSLREVFPRYSYKGRPSSDPVAFLCSCNSGSFSGDWLESVACPHLVRGSKAEGRPCSRILLRGCEGPWPVLVCLPSPLLCPRSARALLDPGWVPPSAVRAMVGDLVRVGRALGLAGFATLPVGPAATPSTEGWLCAVPLDMPPFPALEALFRFQQCPVGLAV